MAEGPITRRLRDGDESGRNRVLGGCRVSKDRRSSPARIEGSVGVATGSLRDILRWLDRRGGEWPR
jgi:hypothetical protein